MPEDVTVTVDKDGLNGLLARDGAVAADLLRRAVQVTTAAKRLCPVDTGRLRDSIVYGLVEEGAGLYALVGSDVEYAIYQELGTSRMAAHPYLRPALAAAGR